MRKLIVSLLFIATLAALIGCSKPSNTTGGSNPAKNQTTAQESTPKATAKTMSAGEFDTLLSSLPLTVVSTKYIVQDENYKALYPDMLQAIIKNNTDADIKNAVIAFAAWDKNNLPVKIKGSMDFSDGAYVKEVSFTDINLVGGQTFGEKNGYQVDEKSNIASSKAIVVSYETFSGDKWENPYYDEFHTLYEGKKLESNLTVDVKIENTDFKPSSTSSQKDSSTGSVSADELNALLEKQPLTVANTKYVVQDENYKALYPDLLQAVIKNNTDKDIKNAVVAFAAWDKNKLPVKIKGNMDFNDGSYIKKVNYSDINLVGGKTYGEDSGLELAENSNIASFKAIVVSYETFDGDKWENPYFEQFRALYENKKLN